MELTKPILPKPLLTKPLLAKPLLAKPTAILFDWDNTLVDTWPLIHQSLHATMEKWGQVPWSFDEVKQKVGKSMRDSFPEMFGETWEEAGEFYLQTYRAFPMSELNLLDGALEMLELLQQSPVKVGLVSNKMGESLRREVQQKDLGKYFDVLVGAGDAKRDKPYSDPAELALEKLGLAMDKNVWFIGDTITDLGCANAGGMSAILYGDVEVQENHIYQGHNFIYHAKNHTELIELLHEYN